MSTRVLGALLAAAASFVLALLVAVAPLDVRPLPRGQFPQPIPAPCAQAAKP